MSALQFINMLESKGLLDPEIIAELHRQVEQSKARVTPEAIAKVLVENGQLTRFQATKLVTELNEKLGSTAQDATTALRGGKPIESAPSKSDSVDDLLPPDEPAEAEVVESVEVVEEVVEVVAPIAESRSSKNKKSKSSAASSVFDEAQPAAKPPKPSRDPLKKSPWESFGIVGVSFILLLLIILFVPLYIWFARGSAKDEFAIAEELYKNRDYERAPPEPQSTMRVVSH